MQYSKFEEDFITDFVSSDLTKLRDKILELVVTDPQEDGSHKLKAAKRCLQLLHHCNLTTIPEYYWGFTSYDFTRELVSNCTTLTNLAIKNDYFSKVYKAMRSIADKSSVGYNLYQLVTKDLLIDLNIEYLIRSILLISLLKGHVEVDKVTI